MATTHNTLVQFCEWYDRIAQGTDTFDKFQHHLHNQLRGLSLAGKRILEVGCGTGTVSLYLALFGGCSEVVAVDEAAGRGAPVGVTQVLKDAIAAFALTNITVVEVDIMTNTFPDEAFDIIIANRALHHVVKSGLLSHDNHAYRSYVQMFGEFKRLLVREGLLTILEISRLSFWRWSPIKLRQKEIDWELHPTRAEWLFAIREAGLKVRSCDYVVPYSLRRFKPFLANSVAQFMLGPSFVITAQK